MAQIIFQQRIRPVQIAKLVQAINSTTYSNAQKQTEIMIKICLKLFLNESIINKKVCCPYAIRS